MASDSRRPPARPGTAAASTAARRVALGRMGEDLAARYLERQGLRLLERGFRSRHGEIDIVAEDGEVLVFVEVKTRSGGAFGTPGEAVDRRKQARMARSAVSYLLSRARGERPCRFDVVEVLSTGPGREARLNHIRNAFEAL